MWAQVTTAKGQARCPLVQQPSSTGSPGATPASHSFPSLPDTLPSAQLYHPWQNPCRQLGRGSENTMPHSPPPVPTYTMQDIELCLPSWLISQANLRASCHFQWLIMTTPPPPHDASDWPKGPDGPAPAH